jgi:hypothetical protein
MDEERSDDRRLSAALEATRAGHFTREAESFLTGIAWWGRVASFLDAAPSTELSLLYLRGALLRRDQAEPVIVPVHSGSPRTDDEGRPLSSLAADLNRIDRTAMVVVLLDLDVEAPLRDRMDEMLRTALPERVNVLVIAMSRAKGLTGLDQLMGDYLTGRHADVVYGQPVTVADIRSWLAAPGQRVTLIGTEFPGDVVLAAGPLDPDTEYVLDVLGDRSIGQVTNDLRRRYRLTNPDDPAAVRRDVETTLAFWKRLRRDRRSLQTLIDELHKEHRDRYQAILASPDSLRWFVDVSGEHRPPDDTPQDPGEPRARELGARLEGAAEPWHLLTPGEFRVLAHRHGDDLTRRSMQARNIKIIEPIGLPLVPPAPGADAVHTWVIGRGWRHLLDAVTGSRGAGSIARGWLTDASRAAAAVDGGTLDGHAIGVLLASGPRPPDDVRQTLEIFAELTPADLRLVFLYEVSSHVRGSASASKQLEHLIRLGFDDVDARLIGFSIANQRTATELRRCAELAGRPPVHPLLRALDEFENRHGGAAAVPGLQLVRDVAGARIRRVHECLARAEAEGVDAWPLLMRAQEIAPDVAELRAAWAKHPPAAVREVHAIARPPVVEVMWEASAADGQVTYDVFRGQGEPPDQSRGGERVASGLTDASFVDGEAPANVPLWYSVRSVRREVASTPTCSGRAVRVLPAATGLRVAADDGTVVLTWGAPEAATSTRVERRSASGGDPSDVPAEVDRARDTGLINGVAYTYLVTVEYETEDGERLRSLTEESAPVIPRPPLRRLSSPGVVLDPQRQGRLLVSGIPDGPPVTLLIASRPFEGDGELSVDELERHGRLHELRVNRDRTADVPVPPGDRYFALVDLAGDRARVGRSTWWGAVPVPTGVTAVRRGDQVELFWDQMPDQPDLVVEVRCAGGEEPKVVTAAEYANNWPILLSANQDELRVSITPRRTAHSRDGRHSWTVLGTTQELVAPACVQVRYRVIVRRGTVQGGWSAALELRADRPVTVGRLEVVVLPGNRHPIHPADTGRGGRLLTAEGLAVEANGPAVVELGQVGEPSRVRCFTSDPGIALIHPPVAQRRVGR